MSDKLFKLTLTWIAGGTVAYMLAYYPISAVFTGSEYIPYGPDAFYHARRILNLLDTGVLLQFDPHINAPYGSLVSWPWAYDTLMGFLIYVLEYLFYDMGRVELLVKIPPAYAYINAALIVAISVALKLRYFYVVLAVFCFALSPLTQQLHMIGNIDHHMVECSFVLASIFFGVLFMQRCELKFIAFFFGVILGSSMAFHNGLFILQIPLLITLFVLWMYKEEMPKTTAFVLMGLMASVFLSSLFSEAFKYHYFAFYYLSWFHVYVTCSTSLIVGAMCILPAGLKNIIFLSIVCMILSIPVFGEFVNGLSFVGSRSLVYLPMDEMRTLLQWDYDMLLLNISLYSILYLMLPLSFVSLVVWLRFDKSAYCIYFAVFALMGSVLLLSQFRFHYFGSFALYFPILIGAMLLIDRTRKHQLFYQTALAAFLLVGYLPGYQQLFLKRPLGGSYDYEMTHYIYNDLRKACNDKPGVVLADYNDGHFITYHTNCSVISNNMIMTPLDYARFKEAIRLMKLPHQEIVDREDWIDYIYVRREDNIFVEKSIDELSNINAGLRYELLFNDEELQNLQLLSSVYFYDKTPVAKVFRVLR